MRKQREEARQEEERRTREEELRQYKARTEEAQRQWRETNERHRAEDAEKAKRREEKFRWDWKDAFGADFPNTQKTASSDNDLRRSLAKVLGLLNSDHAGEVINAARQAERYRQELGLTWYDLLRVSPG